MVFKTGSLLLAFLAGSLAFPLNEEQDMSIFFDHPDATPLIIGGSPAGRVPHMVALVTGLNSRSLMCGGSLVTKRHVLTAAHCIRALFTNGALTPYLSGIVDTNRWNTGGIEYTFAGNITHPNYVQSTVKNDIGILITSKNVVLNNNVGIVPLTYDFIGRGVAARVNGWSRTEKKEKWLEDVIFNPILLELRTTVIDGDQCVRAVAEKTPEINIPVPDVDPQIEICTFLAVNYGNCHGDSGGALVRESDGHQIGVVSWVLPCARGAPDMYVRVSAYRSWIEESIQ